MHNTKLKFVVSRKQEITRVPRNVSFKQKSKLKPYISKNTKKEKQQITKSQKNSLKYSLMHIKEIKWKIQKIEYISSL